MTNYFRQDIVVYFSLLLMLPIFLLFNADPGLRDGWFHGDNPYSPLWYLLNPGYWMSFEMMYAVGLVWAFGLLYWYLYTKKKLGFKLIYAWLLTNTIWIAFGVTENITVTLFIPLAMIWLPVILLAPLQKIPIGWSWNLSDLHWHCAFAWPGGWITNYPECTVFDRWALIGPHAGLVYTYILLVGWFAYPFVYRFWIRFRQRRKTD